MRLFARATLPTSFRNSAEDSERIRKKFCLRFRQMCVNHYQRFLPSSLLLFLSLSLWRIPHGKLFRRSIWRMHRFIFTDTIDSSRMGVFDDEITKFIWLATQPLFASEKSFSHRLTIHSYYTIYRRTHTRAYTCARASRTYNKCEFLTRENNPRQENPCNTLNRYR